MTAGSGDRGVGGSATRRRERLASPLGLALAGAAFAVAFVALAPSRDAFTLDTSEATSGRTSVDDLRLAYLRARGASDALEPNEALDAVMALAREGRIEDAKALLAASPSSRLDPVARLAVDVELAAGAVRRADRARAGGVRHEAGGTVPGDASGRARDPLAGEASRARLAAALERLLAAAGERDMVELERGAELASLVDDAGLGAAFLRRLAGVDPARAVEHLAGCGRRLAASGRRGEAVDCLIRARAASDDPKRRFALGLELLVLLPAEAPDSGRAALVDALVRHPDASVAELDALATTLLAIERPGAAARVHARLANLDTGSRGRWLMAAARWSEAAGRPAEAAVHLDAMTLAEIDGDIGAHRSRIEALLVAAGRTRDALARAAERVMDAPTDPGAVRDAVALAEAEGELERALSWNAALLVARPEDVEALARQSTLALAVGRPALAREATARTLALAPDDVDVLARLARLAEWDGDPDAALRHRRRLLALRGDDDDLVQVARLAELVRRPAVAADALVELARRSPPDDEAVRRIVRLHELDGRPDAAAAALEDIMARHGTRARTLHVLAELHRRHVRYRDALGVWERFADAFGRSAEETLWRVELHWRLGEEDRAAALARGLETMTFGSEASDYQASLLAEIGWRYRLPGVASLARPLVAGIDDADRRRLHGRRAIDALVAAGDTASAAREAESLWRASGDSELALLALRLAIESGDDAAAARLLADTAEVEGLRARPAYWSLRATLALREGDAAAARRAYRTALGIDADDVEAIGGLLWLHIGERDTTAIVALLDTARERALEAPVLWPAFAVGHASAGDARGSLPWFESALESEGADYALVLSFADALEAAGRVEHARRVRRHAVLELRPRLLDAVAGDRDELLRRYGAVLARHGGAEANEAWMRYVLATGRGAADDASFWREDMAISWLMATGRHEHARLIMARRHERRLAAPAWQDLALALRADDVASVRAMLASGGGLSSGDRILALRHVGRDADAWALALRTLDGPASAEDRRVAATQYTELARFRSSHAGASVRATSGGGLDTVGTGVSFRHAIGAAGLGIGLDVVRERFSSNAFGSDVERARSDVALNLFGESPRQGFSLTLGLVDAGDDDTVRGAARYARRDVRGRGEAALELAHGETADGSPVLRLGATRSRAGASLDARIATRGFSRVSLEANEVRVRGSGARLARGVAGRAELGLRGTSGAFAWSGSVAAAGADNERVETLPDGLEVIAGTDRVTGIDDLIARRVRTLSLNGSIARGGEAFRGAATPRWFVNGGLSRALPDGALGLQLDAGAGFRVLGDDELAVAFTRDARLSGARVDPDSSALGIAYRHRF